MCSVLIFVLMGVAPSLVVEAEPAVPKPKPPAGIAPAGHNMPIAHFSLFVS